MMKRQVYRVLLVAALLVLCLSGCQTGFPFPTAPAESLPAPPPETPESPASEPQTPDPEPLSEDWRLVLVSKEHPLEREMEVELADAYGYPVDARITGPLRDMVTDAAAEGVSLIVCYGYRSFAQSGELFEKQISRQMARGLDYEQAAAEAARWVAPPGASDHHTGLAVDIVTQDYQELNAGFASTEAARWMAENSPRYGFIVRYPADKQELTGIVHEPWHLRYVGLEHAAAIAEAGLCLEEYLEMLRK